MQKVFGIESSDPALGWGTGAWGDSTWGTCKNNSNIRRFS